MLTAEHLRHLKELESSDPLQRVFAALWLFQNLPMAELAHCTPKEINAIAAKIDPRPE